MLCTILRKQIVKDPLLQHDAKQAIPKNITQQNNFLLFGLQKLKLKPTSNVPK